MPKHPSRVPAMAQQELPGAGDQAVAMIHSPVRESRSPWHEHGSPSSLTKKQSIKKAAAARLTAFRQRASPVQTKAKLMLRATAATDPCPHHLPPTAEGSKVQSLPAGRSRPQPKRCRWTHRSALPWC